MCLALCLWLSSACSCFVFFFFSSRRRHTRWPRDWSSDVCSSDLVAPAPGAALGAADSAPDRPMGGCLRRRRQLALPGGAMIWLLFAYLCGSIPFGLLIARATSGKDVRTVGSGNIGATNVARAAGKSAAAATLALDALKGFVPVALARGDAAWLPTACAVGAVLGHCFPVWLKFRGGKGVATGFGVSLALAPWAALAGAATWGVLY